MTKIEKKDIENIKVLLNEVELKNVSRVRIKKGDYEIEIDSINTSHNQNVILPSSNKIDQNDKPDAKEVINEENLIKSPMVGVAYLSADPNSSPYIKIGQHVKAGDTLLLIEAMKTFNEIKAPRSGIIKKILALNSQPVEYGDILIIFE